MAESEQMLILYFAVFNNNNNNNNNKAQTAILGTAYIFTKVVM